MGTTSSTIAAADRDEDVVVVTNVQPAMRADEKTPVEATTAVIDLMRKAAIERAEDGAPPIDLFVLPELCPIGYSEDTFAKYLPKTKKLQDLYHDIDRMLAEAAEKLGAYICYGTIGWEKSEDDDETLDFYIRQVVVDTAGKIIASYDKIYICDYGDCAETRFFKRGKSLTSFRIRNITFGIIICADMRYPSLTQKLTRERKIDVLLNPACFMRDLSFATWHAFRTTRAVENGVYVSAGNYAGDYFGNAAFIPPWVDENHTVRELGKEVDYLIESVSRGVLDHARQLVPFNRQTVEGSRV